MTRKDWLRFAVVEVKERGRKCNFHFRPRSFSTVITLLCCGSVLQFLVFSVSCSESGRNISGPFSERASLLPAISQEGQRPQSAEAPIRNGIGPLSEGTGSVPPGSFQEWSTRACGDQSPFETTLGLLSSFEDPLSVPCVQAPYVAKDRQNLKRFREIGTLVGV